MGNPWAGGVTSFYLLTRRGGFSEGLGTSRRRRVIEGTDTSSRVQCPLCDYPSSSFYLLVTEHTLTHLRPGPSGVKVVWGVLVGGTKPG
jgi:hypothetical protein